MDTKRPDPQPLPMPGHPVQGAGTSIAPGGDFALTVLDGLDAIVYVADIQTRELLFLNEYARRVFGDATGQICYQALQNGQDAPCAFCNNDKLIDAEGRPTGPIRWEFQNTRNGRWYDIVDRAIPWSDGRMARLEIAIDVTDRKAREQSVSHQARHDALTGVLNRYELQEVLEKVHAGAERANQNYAVILFDLDRFKLINDGYGHHAGDEVLKRVADAAGHCIRKGDWLGRWGGEEFLCVLPGASPKQAMAIAERIRSDVEHLPLRVEGRTLSISTSVGVSSYPEDATAVDTLISCADSALYEAKRAGRNRVSICQGGTGVFSIAGQLEEALRRGRIQPAYQPIVDIATGEIVAEEALARLVLDNGQVMEAGRFIQAAADLQLAHRIDSMIISATINRCTLQVSCGDTVKHFVNASADLLRHPDLIQRILDEAYKACNASGDRIGPEKPLVIEITEREFIGDTRHVRRVLAPLIDFGLTIAIDDFGSGYSSFQYLADLPVSFLKIEGSLIQRMKDEPQVRSIVRGIHDISRDLGVKTVAEQIENEETRDILREIGVDWGQGYFYGKPEL